MLLDEMYSLFEVVTAGQGRKKGFVISGRTRM